MTDQKKALTISLRIDAATKLRLEKVAKAENRSLSNLIVFALRQYLDERNDA